MAAVLSTLLTILEALLIFGTFIFVHELGHYVFARIFDVEITEFAIGMGPKVFSRVSKKTGIRYSLRAFPIGGFVQMVGENEECPDNPRAFGNKKGWQKFIITSAGGTVNIVLGFILMIVYTLMIPVIGGTQIAVFDENATSNQWLHENDIIYSVNGSRVYTANDLVYEIGMFAYRPIDMVVIRDGEKVRLEGVEFPSEEEQGIRLGSYDFKIYREERSFRNIVVTAFSECRMSVKMVFDSLGGLFSGRFGIKHMSGVVGTTEAIGQAAKAGIETLIYFCAIISVNLGIVNLLPVPALDGGHNVFHFLEIIRGKPVNQKYEGLIHGIGMILLLLLIAVITVLDVIKLF